MKKYLSIFVFVAIAVAIFVVSNDRAKAGEGYYEGNQVKGWAWSSTIGWIKFNHTGKVGDGDVSIDGDGYFRNYAWSPNIGWISFEPADLAASPACGNQAKVNMVTGQVTGWMRAISGIGRTDGWDGCIELSGTNHTSPNSSGYNGTSTQGVTMSPTTGAFSGFAWGGPVVGWLNFNPKTSVATPVSCPECAATSFTAVCNANPVYNGGYLTSVTYSISANGSGNYSVTWNGSVNSPTLSYSSPGTYTPTVTVTDTSRSESFSPTCQSTIVVTPPAGQMTLLASKTSSGAGSASLSIKEGDSSFLKWDPSGTGVGTGYACTGTAQTVTGDLSSNQLNLLPLISGWVSNGGGITGNPVQISDSSTSKLKRGTYTFYVRCVKDGYPIKTSSTATIKVQSAVIIEI